MNMDDKAARFAAPDPKHDWIPGNLDLRDTWFPMAYSADVKAHPVRRTVHAQDVYLWREQGRVRAAEFRPGAAAPMRSRPTAFTGGSGHYPVHERYGYVWVWYGNPDHAHEELIPLIPFLPADGVGIPRYTQRSVRFDAASPLSVENLIDLTHADFLHANTIGDGRSESDVVEFSSTSETLTRTRIVTRKSVAPVMRWIGGVRAQYQDLRAVLHVHLRNNLCISYPSFEPGYAIPNVQPFVPVGRHRSRVDQTNYTVHAPAPFRWLMPRISYVIQPQDNSVLRPQNARYFEANQRRDLSSRFDAPGNRYRVLMARLAQRQREGDFGYGADADPAADISRLLGMKA
jgi:phenylpropionate dioxygenase-like ring-hydroxylating dioxygenase large terminal subunit